MIHRRERRLAQGNLRPYLLDLYIRTHSGMRALVLRGCASVDGMAVMAGFGHASVLMLMAVLALAIVAFAMTSIKR